MTLDGSIDAVAVPPDSAAADRRVLNPDCALDGWSCLRASWRASNASSTSRGLASKRLCQPPGLFGRFAERLVIPSHRFSGTARQTSSSMCSFIRRPRGRRSVASHVMGIEGLRSRNPFNLFQKSPECVSPPLPDERMNAEDAQERVCLFFAAPRFYPPQSLRDAKADGAPPRGLERKTCRYGGCAV